LKVAAAEITLLTDEGTALTLRLEQLTASVQLILTLGRGWDGAREATAASPGDKIYL